MRVVAWVCVCVWLSTAIDFVVRSVTKRLGSCSEHEVDVHQLKACIHLEAQGRNEQHCVKGFWCFIREGPASGKLDELLHQVPGGWRVRQCLGHPSGFGRKGRNIQAEPSVPRLRSWRGRRLEFDTSLSFAMHVGRKTK